MPLNNIDTSGAYQSVRSLLSTNISTISENGNFPSVILPYSDRLATGSYMSKILSVDEGIYHDKAFIDCVHELTDAGGNILHVKFRYFAPHETDNLVKVLISYKLTGKIGNLLLGLEEHVNLATRPGISKYVYIASRALSTPTTSTPPPKKSCLIGKRSNKTNTTSMTSRRDALLKYDEDEGDDEFENFLEEDDE